MRMFATAAVRWRVLAAVSGQTTPYVDLVTPFAELAGFDAVVGTRYAASQGTYTGGIDGDFHFHCFEDHDFLTGGDGVAFEDWDIPDIA